MSHPNYITSAASEPTQRKKMCVNQCYMYVLIGATRKEHLQDAIDALSISLSEEDIQCKEAVFCNGRIIAR